MSAVSGNRPAVFIQGFLNKGPLETLAASFYLRRHGYTLLRIGCSTRHGSITDIADFVWQRMEQAGLNHRAGGFDFIAHSMGGLVTHALIRRHMPGFTGRVVMWGTPLQGCEFADNLDGSRVLGPLFRLLGGQAGQDLKLAADDPERMRPLDYEAGMVAGVASSAVYPLSDLFLQGAGPHDGIVPLQRTKREGLRDHVTLDVSHAGMLVSPAVFRQTLHFLRQGRFTPV